MDDAISRAAALKGLEDLNIASFYELNEHSKEAYTEVKAMLKALPSAQPDVPDTNVGDMISRQAALNSPVKMISDGLEWVPVYHIKELPSAQGWIPCSERCPDRSEWYLVTAEWDDGLTVTTKDRYVVGEGWTCAVFGAKCLAWMPLPKPWEGGQDG